MSDRNVVVEGAQNIAIAKDPENQGRRQEQERLEALELKRKQEESLKRLEENDCAQDGLSTQTAKAFCVVALVSVGVMALWRLACDLAPLFAWSWMGKVGGYIVLAGDVGLCVAYVMLHTSKIRNNFAVWGVVGCGLLVLSQLFNVLGPVISGWQWLQWMFSPVGLTGYVFVAISILRFPKTVHPGAKVVGLIGLGYVVLEGLAWIVFGVVVTTTSSFPEQFWDILALLSVGLVIAYALFAVPFAALLFSSKTGVGVGDLAMCANQTRVNAGMHKGECPAGVSRTSMSGEVHMVDVSAEDVKIHLGWGCIVAILGLVILISHYCGEPSSGTYAFPPMVWLSEWHLDFGLTYFLVCFSKIPPYRAHPVGLAMLEWLCLFVIVVFVGRKIYSYIKMYGWRVSNIKRIRFLALFFLLVAVLCLMWVRLGPGEWEYVSVDSGRRIFYFDGSPERTVYAHYWRPQSCLYERELAGYDGWRRPPVDYDPRRLNNLGRSVENLGIDVGVLGLILLTLRRSKVASKNA